MTCGKRHKRLVARTVVVVAALSLIGCGATKQSSTTNPTFAVDPDAIGDAYENFDLGITLHPPAGWIVVSENQRQAVIETLSSQQDEDRYSLQIVDIFFSTEDLSLASLAVITERTGDGVSAQDYITVFAETIGVGAGASIDQALPTMTEYTINGFAVTQFRHIQSERIVYTLLFTTPTDSLVQLDYSIPTAAYQAEGNKLESSIGTLGALE